MTKKESQKESGHSCPPAGWKTRKKGERTFLSAKRVGKPALLYVTGWKTRAPLKDLSVVARRAKVAILEGVEI